MSYFASFPTMQYANVAVVDVTRRVTVPESVLRQPTAFSPYTVEGQRQDLVSYLYYGQDDDDWIISLANQIVDPYYGWHLVDDDFNALLVSKYGSLQEAFDRVKVWGSNWADDPRAVTPAYYDALTENLKKYWVPQFGNGTRVLSYSRRQEDWTAATNGFMDVALADPTIAAPGLLAYSYDGLGNVQGKAEVDYVGTTVKLKHVRGVWSNSSPVRTTSGNSVLTSVGALDRVIPVDEEVYFSPVSFYDHEYDLNEENKEVLLIQSGYRGLMYSGLARQLVA